MPLRRVVDHAAAASVRSDMSHLLRSRLRLFFFSSRRRHTRWNCDWSSDVCSSDLGLLTVLENLLVAAPDNRGESLLGALLGKRYWMPDETRLVVQARSLLKRFGLLPKESDYAGML